MRSPFAPPPPVTGLVEELAGTFVLGVAGAIAGLLWPSEAPLQRAALVLVLAFIAAVIALWWLARGLFFIWCVIGAVGASYRTFHPKDGE